MQNDAVCHYLNQSRIIIMPHVSPDVLSRRQVTVGLYSLSRALEVNIVFLGAYNMKMPYTHITFIDHMDVPRGAPVAQYNLGRIYPLLIYSNPCRIVRN